MKKIKVNRYIISLSILSVLILASVIRYGLRSYQIPIWDEQHYMSMATGFYKLFLHPALTTPHDMLQIVPFRQPGYPLLIIPFYFLFGLSKAYFWAQVTNGLLYITTIWGIYFLAKIYLSRLASFLAAFMFAFYGWTLFYLNQTYSETAVSAFVVLSILFLMKSNYFQLRKFSVLFGLFFGMAILMKWVSLVYVFGPLLYVAYQIFAKRLFMRRQVIFNVISASLLTLLIAIYPYYTNFNWYFENWYSHRQGGPIWEVTSKDERNPLSIYSLTFYLTSFAKLGILYFVLFLSGFLLAFKKKGKLKPFLITFLVGYVFSVYALLKAERHILPIFPYIAILSASVFDSIRNSKIKWGLVVFTFTLSILSFLGSVWGRGPMKQSLVEVNNIYLTTISRPPNIYKISGREILEYIEKDSKLNKTEDPKVLQLFYYRPLDEPLMTYNLYEREKPFQMNNYLGTIIANPEKDAESFLKDTFDNADYILVKSGQKTDTYFSEPNYATLKALIMLFDKHIAISEYYEKKAEIWINQDSSTVTIYKKKKNISSELMGKMKMVFIKLLE